MNNITDAFVADFVVIAENNWWGNAAGPDPAAVIEVEGGSLDYMPFLTTDPGDKKGTAHSFKKQSRVSQAQSQFSNQEKAIQEMLLQRSQMLDESSSFDEIGLKW